jgi:hypothetical protein
LSRLRRCEEEGLELDEELEDEDVVEVEDDLELLVEE